MRNAELVTKSFEAAYDEYLEQIFLFLFVRLGDRERAKDLTQETFMRVWKYMAEGKQIRTMRPFLYTTAYNIFKNEIRAKKETSSLDALMQKTAYEPRANDMTLDTMIELKLLLAHIDELKSPYREALIMRYVDGLTIKEIAEVLEKSPIAISVTIHRGIHKLRAGYSHAYERNIKTA